MAKKIYDIVPPKLVRKKIERATKVSVSRPKNKKEYMEAPPVSAERKKKRSPLKGILIGGGVVVILLAFYLYYKLPKAEIGIWPKMDDVSLQEKIKADTSVNKVDSKGLVIPARYVEQERDGLQEFDATGATSNDGKASGTITVYNKIDSSESFTLKKGTHFLSDSGVYFVALDKFIVPKAQYKSGKLVPGSIDIAVQAQDPGENSNVGPSKFSIPKLSGTSYYYSIYGASQNPMQGGYKGQVKKVTKDDLDRAKAALTKKLFDLAKEDIKNKLSQDDILINDSIAKDILDASSAIKEGAVVDKFNEQAKVKVSALVFKKQDLEKFAKDDIAAHLESGQILSDKSLNLDYKLESIDIKGGKMAVNLTLSAKKYRNIDTDNLTDSLIDKSKDQITKLLDEKYSDSISQVTVNFWPFWVQRAPKDKARVKVNLKIE